MSEDNASICEINDFAEFLEKCLNRNILDFTLKPLTKPGDNYRSIMQLVEVQVSEKNGCAKVNTK